MIPVCLALAAAQISPCAQAPGWRTHATDADRERLRDWRTAWSEALEQARAKSQGPAADPLFDFDHALDRPLPPAGAYRCRFVKVGGAAGFAARDWGRCRIEGDRFAKLDGPQRPTGRVYADGPSRGVFLGTLLLGDEARPLDHGRDAARDMAGYVERVGDARWRVVLPYPAFESTLDVIELVPA